MMYLKHIKIIASFVLISQLGFAQNKKSLDGNPNSKLNNTKQTSKVVTENSKATVDAGPEYDVNKTTLKFRDVYTYVDVYYVDEVNTADLTVTAMKSMAQVLDSAQADQLVSRFKSTEFPTLGFNNLFNHLNKELPDSIDRESLVDDAIRLMLEELDPHTGYFTADQYKEMSAPLKGNFEGVGIRFQILKDTLMVVNPIPNGPSESVGIIAGDKIIAIDGEVVAGVGLKNSGVRDRLLGSKGSEVQLQIQRKNVKKLIDFTVIRDKIPVYSMEASYMATPEIGYIKLNNFSATTMIEIRGAMDSLKNQGMKKLVLDLQGNGGGYLTTANDLANEFLSDKQLIVYTEGRAFPTDKYFANALGGFEKGELIVLIDQSSASASEIVSGAIQDWDRGLIVGRRSFGKGLVQKQIMLRDESAMRLTTSRYYTPTGRSIQKPYADGLEAYYREKYERLANGELTDISKIDLPDSLKYNTLVTKRDVYGGGGILPDVFVPLDTSHNSDYFFSLLRSGHLNTFSLTYVDEMRENLSKSYPDFASFKANFDPIKSGTLQELIDYAKSEDLEFNAEEYKISEKLIAARLKASIASNMWDSSKFYEVINDYNESLQKAIEIMNSGDYRKMKLAMNK